MPTTTASGSSWRPTVLVQTTSLVCLCLWISCFTSTSDGAAQCPPRWVFYKPGKLCLRTFFLDELSFSSARLLCRDALGFHDSLSDLVTITDTRMYAFINQNVIDKNDEAWIGLNVNGTFLNGKNASFLAFSAGTNNLTSPPPPPPDRCVFTLREEYEYASCSKDKFGAMCSLPSREVDDSCETKNGGCSHVCTPGFRKRVCSCPSAQFPVGFMLENDGMTCRETPVNFCHPNNGGCDHVCKTTKLGPSCTCHHGYRLGGGDGGGGKLSLPLTTCVDIDECADGLNGGCQHNCTNTVGDRSCSCREGYFKVEETLCEVVMYQPSAGDGVGGIDKAKTIRLSLIAIAFILSLALLGKVAKYAMLRYCMGIYRDKRPHRKEGGDDAEKGGAIEEGGNPAGGRAIITQKRGGRAVGFGEHSL